MLEEMAALFEYLPTISATVRPSDRGVSVTLTVTSRTDIMIRSAPTPSWFAISLITP